MKVKVEYTIYKTMEIEVPKALSEAYRKAKNFNRSIDINIACNDIGDFVEVYVNAEEGIDNVDSVFGWDEVEG